MILVTAKGSDTAQFRHQKREKALSLLKIWINIFNVSRGGEGYRGKRTIDISCGKSSYVRLP